MSNNSAAQLRPSVDDDFLKWFADAGYPMLELKLQLGGLEYFHFSSFFTQADGRSVASFGSSQFRKTAALKCAGEAIERQAMANYFVNQKHDVPAAFCNSNGWAVHTSESGAIQKATSEALERHLLLKSYLSHGWEGFNFVQEIEAGEIKLRLLTARCTANGKIAGLVAAKSKSYNGVSFGYCLGDSHQVQSAEFWQSAIFEAADKFLLLDKQEPGATDDETWLRTSVKSFLHTSFDMSPLGQKEAPLIKSEIGEIKIHHTDLRQSLGIDCPLHAAFVYGGNLIPLFWKSELDARAMAWFTPILERNGIYEIPEEHPIL